jgi:sugar phosphate isomerase/epimerase
MEEGLLRSIEATKMLGGEICATHPRSFFINGELTHNSVDEKQSLRVNLENYKPLVEAAEKYGVLLGVENLMRYSSWRVPFYSFQVKDQIELIDKLNSPNVCAVWDFGHANLIDGGYDQAESIKALGNRIKGTHVHNNDGRQDLHLPPFTPDISACAERVVDWDKTLGEFRDFGYGGYLTQEPSWNYSGPLKSYIQFIYDSLVMLDEKLKGENQ